MSTFLPEPTGWLFLVCAWLAVARVQGAIPAHGERGADDAACFVLRRMPLLARVHLPGTFLVVVLALGFGPVTWTEVVAAIFAVGHVVHTRLRACPRKARLRGRIYCVNLVAVLLLVGEAVVRGVHFVLTGRAVLLAAM